jgi:hypothetical protein
MNDDVSATRRFFRRALALCFSLLILGGFIVIFAETHGTGSLKAYGCGGFCLFAGAVGCWVVFVKINRCDHDTLIINGAIARCQTLDRSLAGEKVTPQLRKRYLDSLDEILNTTLTGFHRPLGSLIKIPDFPIVSKKQAPQNEVIVEQQTQPTPDSEPDD